MGFKGLPWGLTGALIATTYLHSTYVTAGPSINVALKTSFNSAPYIVELLETAAEENSTSYFPLLDRIANGHFSQATTDKDLYELFIKTLKEDGHITDAETIASYQLALSLRTSAPRIEAHYQFYDTAVEPTLSAEQDTSCPVWVQLNDKQYCSPTLEESHGDVANIQQDLPFDRILGNSSAPASVLYADITSPTFAKFHKTLVNTARAGKTSYRVRHRSSLASATEPLIINGYGVQLALKRTDYIVIDDRDDGGDKTQEKEISLDDEDLADLKPLSTSQLVALGLQASTYIMQSENPFETLLKVSQDFPKYSSAMTAVTVSPDFLAEHQANRAELVPPGFNVFWLNGRQITEREVDPFSLLDILRRERRLINGIRDLGLTGKEAVDLLGHQEVALVKATDEPQRFDWRDTHEDELVIIWLNNIEKDKKYKDWPVHLTSMLQRTYPGQIPAVRKDVHNLIVPIDFSNVEDLMVVTQQLVGFVNRKLPIRVGLVPLTATPGAVEQAKIVYHIITSYGLSGLLAYLDEIKTKKPVVAKAESLEAAIKDRTLRADKVEMSLDEILTSENYEAHVNAAQKWVTRLAADTKIPPVFVNGIALPRGESWLQAMSNRITSDLQNIQRAIYQEEFTTESWLPEFFLATAVTRRNALVIPEDEALLKILDVSKLSSEHNLVISSLPRVPADAASSKGDWASMFVVADLDTEYGQSLLQKAAMYRTTDPGLELIVVHNPSVYGKVSEIGANVYAHAAGAGRDLTGEELVALITKPETVHEDLVMAKSDEYWKLCGDMLQSIGVLPGQHALLVNGRLVGPIPSGATFEVDDFAGLLDYERQQRITPALKAMVSLGLSEKITDPFASAKISSIVALSTTSDVPEGMFEETSTLRISAFDVWQSAHTAIEVGDKLDASIHITASIDPASEVAQRWIPILKVLSELDGVHLKLYVNPKDRIQELPVRRFYRYVLDSKPTFEQNGTVRNLGASFKGVPQEALLTVGLDVPSPWLVAAKESVYDLDNVKLSSAKSDVNALFELEYILIEGHSREVPSLGAPRGAQLVLGTERDPHFADTIIMANLGYFQFKANPGFYKISLQEGRSDEIYHIDSIGALGYSPVAGDDSTEIVLMSFKGVTLYPRLSRKPGKETEEVLEAKVDSPIDLVAQGLKFAQSVLGRVPGLSKAPKHADINIFSVASGHLYERMLNIMMVSVMKNTKHTVKFWFIEQFLSPSFKDFIPYLAEEYGFEYEMVTYKWPHWLRAQTEKQREIWGYKILFLDVLFPLSLDKVIFVDADQIVRTDMIELVNHDLEGAPYGFTPMGDSRTEMEGFRFWKQGYWKNFLKGLPYHISALYVVDLRRFRQIAAGDRLRQQYHTLSADPASLSNLDQDLPNHMQMQLPIHSLPEEWLWCETWCSDESLAKAKTIDLCNNPQTKEPKLDRARRQVPEWTIYDDEIAAVDRKRKQVNNDNVEEKEENTKSKAHEEPAETYKKDEL